MAGVRRVVVAGALVPLGGALLMGANPAPPLAAPPLPVPPSPQDRAAYMAKVLPTPMLYAIRNTVDGKAGPTGEACLSAESVARQADVARTRVAGGDRPAWQGCTHTSKLLGGGGMHMEISCDKAAGAERTYRAVSDIDGQLGMRQHMEAQVDGPKGPRTLVTDVSIEAMGACPADLKPGEMRLADGRKVEAAAALSRGAAK